MTTASYTYDVGTEIFFINEVGAIKSGLIQTVVIHVSSVQTTVAYTIVLPDTSKRLIEEDKAFATADDAFTFYKANDL